MEHSLSQGNVYKQLMRLSIPIMGTSLIQTSHGLMNMFWLGKLSPAAVSAAGMAGYVGWIAFAFAILCRVGGEVGVGQSVGKEDERAVQSFIDNALGLGVLMAAIIAALAIFFRYPLMGFFRIQSRDTLEMAVQYLSIVMLALPINYATVIISGIYHGFGNSKLTFKINAAGMATNMILSPILMFILKLGVKGAAISTATSQTLILVLYIMSAKDSKYFKNLRIFRGMRAGFLKTIVSWGAPVAAHSRFFATISSFVSRIITGYGDYAFAAYEIGGQIEAISFLTFGGMSTAISVFVSQNYGAGNKERLREGVRKGFLLSSIFGILGGLLLFFGSEKIFRLFLDDPDTIRVGVSYLKFIAFTQLFTAWESAAGGTLNGLGKTIYNSTTGVLSNGLRLPLAHTLSAKLGINGVWWAINISCVLKGTLPLPFVYKFSKHPPARKEILDAKTAEV